MAPPAFRKPPQAPPVFTGTVDSVMRDAKNLIARSGAMYDGIVARVDPAVPGAATFESVMGPQLADEGQFALEARILCFYQSVSTDPALRNVSSQVEQLLDEFSIEMGMRQDLFERVKAVVADKEAVAKLDGEDQRVLQKEYREFLRNGLGLQGEERERFKEIKRRLSAIQNAFQKNLTEENGGLWFTREEMDGVPDDVIDGLKVGTKEDGENEGKLFVTFKYPDLFPTLKYATNSETRRKLMVENERKMPANVPLFKEAIVLRDEAARLLGYPNHAAFKVETKMAKTAENVDKFLGNLRERLIVGGKAELEKLKALKAADLKERGLENDGHYYLWDNRYYDRLMVEKDYQVDHQLIAEYFPLETTIRGMLEIFEHLFGLKFVELKSKEDRDAVAENGQGSDIVWHEDVQFFSVWNDESEGGEFVGYFYLDLFPREGKYGHAANFNLQPGFINMTTGKRHYPATALVCNFSKPTKNKPSLLKHDEVVTLFHELGHGIHDLVARTKYARFHGTDVVRDFVEAPSQMLENWCWTPSQLGSLSNHYSWLSDEYKKAWEDSEAAKGVKNPQRPPQHIPADLVDKLIATKHVNEALFNLRQLHFGIFDMTIHEGKSQEQIKQLNASALYNALRRDISCLDGMDVFDGSPDDWAQGQATFGHLMGGYDAGYYGYLYSQVYSTDMFYSAFKKDPMDKATGRRYRYTVLGRGGSKDELEVLKEFLGREPSPEAFYKDLGLEN